MFTGGAAMVEYLIDTILQRKFSSKTAEMINKERLNKLEDSKDRSSGVEPFQKLDEIITMQMYQKKFLFENGLDFK